MNDTVLNSPTNPLLVVNQRLQHTLAQQRKQRGGATQPLQASGHKLALSVGVAAGGTTAALGSPKGGGTSARAAAAGALTGRSALSASATAGAAGAAGLQAASLVAGGLVMSPRSATAPAPAVR